MARRTFTMCTVIHNTIKSNKNQFGNNIIVKLGYYLIIHKNNTFQQNSNFIAAICLNIYIGKNLLHNAIIFQVLWSICNIITS